MVDFTCVIHESSIFAWSWFFGSHLTIVSYGTFVSCYIISGISSSGTECAVVALVTVVGHSYLSCGFTVLPRITIYAILLPLFTSIGIV